MNKVVQHNGVLSTIRYSAAGLSLAELQQRHPDVPRRTLQRWTQKWLQEGAIGADGQGRGRRYLSPRYALNHVAEPLLDSDESPTDQISLSADSRDIAAHVRTDWRERPAVQYQRSFLDAYQPNSSAYLSDSLRYQLNRMGKPLEDEAPSGTFARDILDRLLIDLSWASSHLEGNTYSLLDTAKLIQRNIIAEGKSEFETLMILNHKSAIEFLVENTNDVGFDRYTSLNLHAMLSENLLPNSADEGRLRELSVGIGQCAYTPIAAGAVLKEIFDQILFKALKIVDPFEQSFFILVHLPYLQPFIDVNKRTARLMANIPLLRANLCPLTFIGMPSSLWTHALLGIYELNRIELLRDVYVYAYRQSVGEYLTLKRDLVAPDSRTRKYRLVIKQIVEDVVLNPDRQALEVIDAGVADHVLPEDQTDVRARIIQAINELDQGRVARYGLRPSDLEIWQDAQ